MKPNKSAYHLLVVDDDIRIRSLLQKYLIEQGYFVSSAQNTTEADFLQKKFQYNLIILDVMMLGESGTDYTKRLRNNDNNIPIIMLTAMGTTDACINGLEVGADDYIVKPFEPKELLLRITKILKRNYIEDTNFYFGDFSYNIQSQILLKQEDHIFLTHSEHSLLKFLLKNPNKIISRDYLSKELSINDRSVDVQIIRLRNKIETNPSKPLFLRTVRNQGYILMIQSV